MRPLLSRSALAGALAFVVAGGAAALGASGKTMPSVKLRAIDGSSVRLKDLKGKVVLLDFWASWCAPCRVTFPAMNTMQEQLASKGVEVLAINVDERRRDLDAFLSQQPHTMTILLDSRAVATNAFHVRTVPTAFVIDRKGVIRFSHPGYTEEAIDAFRAEITSLLEEPAL